MFERRTVLIVGAGASAEAGLPTGAELEQRVADLLDIRFQHLFRQESGDGTICQALRIAVERGTPPSRDINPHLHSAWRIRDAMPQALSIDNFIDAHQGDTRLELCGKLAIVRSVLSAERQSKLFFDARKGERKPNFHALGKTWFSAFFQLLTENCRAEHLDDRLSTIALIVFNYDRCIEHFIFHALQNFYGLNQERAAALMARLAIFHPYGMVGALPWQSRDNAIDFGDEPSAHGLLALADQIRTFTEGTDPARSSIEEIQQRLLQAQIVLFLGFAYHPLNLQLLKTEGATHVNPAATKYFGTALGFSSNDCGVVSDELAALAGAPLGQVVVRNNLTSTQHASRDARVSASGKQH